MAKPAPLVSVVMPVYNGERFLAEAIESILGQTFREFEFLIVDDGSQDGSAAISRSYAERDRRIRCIQLGKNQGEAGARNAGIAAAEGRFVAMMDCDDVSLPERLQLQFDFLDANCEIGAIGVGNQVVNEDLSPLFDYRLPPCHALILLSMLFGETAIARNSIMLRRELIIASGGYNPEFEVATDYEFFLRIVWQVRMRYASLKTILYLYRQHEASIMGQATTHNLPAKIHARREALERLWGEAPAETLDLLLRLRPGFKLGWRERRRARRDLQRLIEAIIAQGWVESNDLPLLEAEIRQRLEWTTPRRWQQFLHWRRHHFGSGKSETAV
ncbi:MAG: glycosyltransferase family 2 protein [Chloroflexi bacterium]|nr:glycosyltransferase family 2 protein [Chloroflexota bacterium]